MSFGDLWRARDIPAENGCFSYKNVEKERMQNNDISFQFLFSFVSKEYDDNECAPYAARILLGWTRGGKQNNNVVRLRWIFSMGDFLENHGHVSFCFFYGLFVKILDL